MVGASLLPARSAEVSWGHSGWCPASCFTEGTEAQRGEGPCPEAHTAGENLSWIQLQSLGLSVTRASLSETTPLGLSHVLKGPICNHHVKR